MTRTVADYELIERCMIVNAATWLEVAKLGQRAGLIHWKVAGILRPWGSYLAILTTQWKIEPVSTS